MGVSRFLKEKNDEVQIVGLQPSEGSQIAGIRRWPKEYLPKIFEVIILITSAISKSGFLGMPKPESSPR